MDGTMAPVPDHHVDASRSVLPDDRADRFPCFDGLRAVAAVTVLVFHAAFQSIERTGAAWWILGRLDVGVAIFFAISGFLLYRPFVVANHAGKPWPQLRGYFRRRLFRIFPAYWVALTVTVYVLGLKAFIGTGSTVANYSLVHMYSARWSYLQGMDQAWTLCVELTFYVALPPFAMLVALASRRIGRRSAEWTGVSLLFIGGLAMHVAWSRGTHFPMWATVLPLNLPLFAGGMMLAIVNVSLAERDSSPAWLTWLTDRPGVLVGGALGAYALMVVVTWGTEGVLTYSASERIALYVLWCIIGFLAVAIAALGRQDAGKSRGVLRNPVIAYVGVVSYGIYLWHQTVLGEIHDKLLSPGQGFKRFAVMVTLGFVVTVGVASLSWFGLERPIMRLARRPLFQRRSPQPD